MGSLPISAPDLPDDYQAERGCGGAMRHVSRLSDSELGAAIAYRRAVCPLSGAEIDEWAGKLKGAGGERRLQKLVTFWFAQASFLASVTEAYEEGRVRDFVNRRLAQGGFTQRYRFAEAFPSCRQVVAGNRRAAHHDPL
jgi:hypothetical protein